MPKDHKTTSFRYRDLPYEHRRTRRQPSPEAKSQALATEQDYHRFERLLKEESVPEQQYEQSKAAFEAAQARYQALVEQKKAAFSQFTETSKKTTGPRRRSYEKKRIWI